MKKMNGAEYKDFMAADWEALLNLTEVYADGQEVTVNGVDEPDDLEEIPDDAKVVIRTGRIVADQDVDMSFESCYMRWKKAQTVAKLVIEVPNESVYALKAFVKGLKGKVLK